MLFVDNWLMMFVNMLFDDHWLMMLMNDFLMMFMEDIFSVFNDNILVMFVDDILMNFFDDGLSNFYSHIGGKIVSFNGLTFIRFLVDGLFLMRDDDGLFVNLFDNDGAFNVLRMSNGELLGVDTVGVGVAFVVDVILSMDMSVAVNVVSTMEVCVFTSLSVEVGSSVNSSSLPECVGVGDSGVGGVGSLDEASS